MLPGQLHRRGREVGGGHPHAALQEFEAVEPHAAADLQQVPALQVGGLALDARHDPRELEGIHPRPDLGKEFAAADFYLGPKLVLHAERVRLPIFIYSRNGALLLVIHDRLFSWDER